MSDRVNATGPEKAKHSVLQELEPPVLEYLPWQAMVFGLTPCGQHFLDITLANKAQLGLADFFIVYWQRFGLPEIPVTYLSQTEMRRIL